MLYGYCNSNQFINLDVHENIYIYISIYVYKKKLSWVLENSCIQFNAHITKYYMSEDACWLAHSDADYEGRTTG